MWNGKHHIDPTLGIGIIIGIMIGAAISQMPCSGIFLIAALVVIVIAMSASKPR
jgi:uncharacterized membrane protein (Fun14 family)